MQSTKARPSMPAAWKMGRAGFHATFASLFTYAAFVC